MPVIQATIPTLNRRMSKGHPCHYCAIMRGRTSRGLKAGLPLQGTIVEAIITPGRSCLSGRMRPGAVLENAFSVLENSRPCRHPLPAGQCSSDYAVLCGRLCCPSSGPLHSTQETGSRMRCGASGYPDNRLCRSNARFMPSGMRRVNSKSF